MQFDRERGRDCWKQRDTRTKNSRKVGRVMVLSLAALTNTPNWSSPVQCASVKSSPLNERWLSLWVRALLILPIC